MRFIVLIALVVLAQSPAMSLIDFDYFKSLKPAHKQVVHYIEHDDSPMEIVKAEVSDEGSFFFKNMNAVYNTYRIKVKNKTNRKIMAYRVTWTLMHPFEDYVHSKIYANSINPVEANATQVLEFKKDKHFRDDSYYYAEISKIEFDDDEFIWEAPEGDETLSRWQKVLQEVNTDEGYEHVEPEVISPDTDTENQ